MQAWGVNEDQVYMPVDGYGPGEVTTTVTACATASFVPSSDGARGGCSLNQCNWEKNACVGHDSEYHWDCENPQENSQKNRPGSKSGPDPNGVGSPSPTLTASTGCVSFMDDLEDV